MRFLLFAALLLTTPAVAQDHPTENPDHAVYVQPPESIARALQTDKNYVSLSNVSPNARHVLVPRQTELSTLDRMSRKTYRLGELELRPATDRIWHLETWGTNGLSFFDLDSGTMRPVTLPEGTFVSDMVWSPDGNRIAFLAHLPNHTELWTADAATGRARSMSSRRVLATVGARSTVSRMVQWLPDGSVVTLFVPEDRGPEPAWNPVPSGPIVRRTRTEPTSSRTWPNLLEDPWEEALFEHYTTSQLAAVDARGRVREVGSASMWESVRVSPDGAWAIASRIERPFSYRTSYRGFPRRTVLLNLTTGEERELSYQPLREGGGGNGGNEPRDFSWAPDGSGLLFLQNSDDGPDTVRRAAAPWDLTAADTLADSQGRISSASLSRDGQTVFAEVRQGGKSGVAWWRGDPHARHMLVDFHETDDPTSLPGDLVTRRTGNGIEYAVLSSDGSAAFLQGPGYNAEFKPQPFIDRIVLDGESTRVFEGTRTSWDRPLAALDDDMSRLLVQRESVTLYPQTYLVEGERWIQLTANEDPFPEVTAAERIDFSFERRDGLQVQGRVSLPVDYEPGTRVPAIFWTYPREYTTAEGYEHAAIRRRNHNAFTHMSWLRWSDLWLKAGYALVYPDIPIVGENYNDTYIGSLVDAMYAAIRAVDGLGVVDIDRIGHGGHSYGAFATANILANAPFFKAGIAGDGAYNRSLTPSGFQAERRTIWEAPHTYIEMSPFFRADQIDTPLLLYHGGDDNNTGTFPVQSRRMIHALTEHGKTAVLYEYPYESHTPRAIEHKLDMWARFVDWMDTYVK
ncbi:MAG: S9 family peptidase [Rhodothermales bacterium]|nr:S9 family peptidase [Rhodothermales bacterium]MBO6779255.1 S9 family peptidase [Rhodothermales bacterium]